METSKKLYEFCTGGMGCSYERSYVWADNDLEAETLFQIRNPDRTIKTKRILLYASTPSFATKLDDEGFPEPPV